MGLRISSRRVVAILSLVTIASGASVALGAPVCSEVFRGTLNRGLHIAVNDEALNNLAQLKLDLDNQLSLGQLGTAQSALMANFKKSFEEARASMKGTISAAELKAELAKRIARLQGRQDEVNNLENAHRAEMKNAFAKSDRDVEPYSIKHDIEIGTNKSNIEFLDKDHNEVILSSPESNFFYHIELSSRTTLNEFNAGPTLFDRNSNALFFPVDQEAFVYNPHTRQTANFPLVRKKNQAGVISPMGDWAAVYDNSSLTIVNTQTHQASPKTFEMPRKDLKSFLLRDTLKIEDVKLISDSAALVTVSKKIYYFNFQTGETFHLNHKLLKGFPGGWHNRFDISPDGKALLFSYRPFSTTGLYVKIADLREIKKKGLVIPNSHGIRSFTEDSKSLIMQFDQSKYDLFELETQTVSDYRHPEQKRSRWPRELTDDRYPDGSGMVLSDILVQDRYHSTAMMIRTDSNSMLKKYFLEIWTKPEIK